MTLSTQEIFDKVSNHLLNQKKQSKRHTGNCVYFGPKGLKCAVGALIKEEAYDPLIDSDDEGDISVCSPRVLKVLKKSEVISSHDVRSVNSSRINLLLDLQTVHDELHPNQWKKALNSVAKLHKLQGIA